MRGGSPEEIAREALRQAAGAAPRDAARLVGRVPGLMAEARRRRAASAAGWAVQGAGDVVSGSLAFHARRVIPSLALVTVVVLAFALLVSYRSASTSQEAAFEKVVLEDSRATQDDLLDAVLDTGRSDG